MLHATTGHVTGPNLAVWVEVKFAVFSCRRLGGPQRLSKTGPALGGQDLHPYNAAQAGWTLMMAQQGFLESCKV